MTAPEHSSIDTNRHAPTAAALCSRSKAACSSWVPADPIVFKPNKRLHKPCVVLRSLTTNLWGSGVVSCNGE